MKKVKLEPEKISGIFLHIEGKWHNVREINVDYDSSGKCGRLEIRYEEIANKKHERLAADVSTDFIHDLKIFGSVDVRDSIFLIKLEANKRISWSLAMRKEIDKNPEFANL